MQIRGSIPTVLGRVVYLAGALNIIGDVFRKFRLPTKEVREYLPIFINSAAFATSLFTGIVMIIIARSLIRRKHRAWSLALFIFAVNFGAVLFHWRRHPAQIAVSAIVIILLLFYRKEFYAQSDPTTKWRPIFGLIFTFIVMFSLGVLLLLNRHRQSYTGSPSLLNIALTVLEGFVGIAGPIEFVNQRTADVIETVLPILGFFILVVPLGMYFRRIRPIPKMTLEESAQVRKLIKHDLEQDSLGYFATRGDKSLVWASNQKAGIAYRVQGGEFSLWNEAITKFLEIAKAHAWTPGVMGCSDRGGEAWVAHAGMLAIDIGDEAIIRVKDFTLEGRAIANVRQMVNRIKRKGYSAYTSKWSEIAANKKEELRKLAKMWRYGVPERGFSMSMDRFGDDIDEETYLTICEKDGEIKGLLYFVPWSTDSLSLDRMQREKDCDAGVNELMIVTTVEFAAANGLKNISLNFAAFRSLFERADKISAGPITRSTRNLIRLFSNFFQVESLYRFNAKFAPDWQTRYVLYPKPAELPKVAFAALRAEKFISSFRKNSAK